MDKKPEQLYLDLLKKTLTFTLWPEPLFPLQIYSKKVPKRLVIAHVLNVLQNNRFKLSESRQFEEARREGKGWPGYAETMIGIKRLDNIQCCIESVIREGVEGDLIETGVWRGGATILMRGVLAAYGIENRRVFVADSFAGLPKPEEKYAADAGDKHHTHKALTVSREDVENNFRKYDLLDDKVVFLQGWFKDTLPSAPIQKLAVMRLDGDMYSSTIEALDALYPKLSVGGYCIIDDYDLKGCRTAVDDYRANHQIKSELQAIDHAGVFWKKVA